MKSQKRFILGSILGKRWLVAIVLNAVVIAPPALRAQDAWQGPTTDSSWFTPGNWSLRLPPTAAQTALVDNGTTAQIAASGAVATTLTIGATVSASTVQLLPEATLPSAVGPEPL